MKLESHVGGLSRSRKERYLQARGWRLMERGWDLPTSAHGPLPLNKAIHHQLTADLCAALGPDGWRVEDYSLRGYVSLRDPRDQSICTLPEALRRQARREQRKVREFTYALFLGAWADS